MRRRPASVSTVNGTVAARLPTSTKATVRLRFIQVEIDTNFDLNLKGQGNMSHIGGQVGGWLY